MEDAAKIKTLYVAVNELMSKLGADGEIHAQTKEAGDVMDALYEIDGGGYNSDISFETRRIEDAKRDPLNPQWCLGCNPDNCMGCRK